MIVQVRMNGARELIRSLSAVEQVVGAGSVQSLGRRLTRETIRIVGHLTPRQKNTLRLGSTKRMPGGTPPLAKRWEAIEAVTTQFAYQSLVRNQASLTPEGAVILAALEFGARPHRMPTSGSRKMAWEQAGVFRLFRFRASADALGGGRDVTDVFDKRRQDERGVIASVVRHPGHRSFRMVEETTRQMAAVSDTMLQVFSRQIREAFFAGFQVSITRV